MWKAENKQKEVVLHKHILRLSEDAKMYVGLRMARQVVEKTFTQGS